MHLIRNDGQNIILLLNKSFYIINDVISIVGDYKQFSNQIETVKNNKNKYIKLTLKPLTSNYHKHLNKICKELNS